MFNFLSFLTYEKWSEAIHPDILAETTHPLSSGKKTKENEKKYIKRENEVIKRLIKRISWI